MRVPEGGVTAVESVFFQLSYLDNFFCMLPVPLTAQINFCFFISFPKIPCAL